jgi:glycosyltransferase involved in cell wall biosynthesis
VVLVNARYEPEGIGGPARSLRIWAERMVRDGHRPTVVCRGGAPRRVVERRRGVEVLRLPPSLSDGAAARAVAEVVERCRPHAVHTHFLKGFDRIALASVLAAAPCRRIHTLHEYSLLCSEGLLFRQGRPCRALCPDCGGVVARARPLAEALDAVVGVSRHVLERHLAEGLFEHTPCRRVIANSYDPPEAGAQTAPRPHRGLRLGYLGRLSLEKGLDHLLDAVNGMPHGAPLELLVAGRLDGPYARALQRRFAGPRIRFVGYADPGRFFPAIDVLVFPSLCEETFGRGVIEAQAHGVPVIVSDRGALPELVCPGATGWVYSPAEPGALQRLIRARLLDRGSLGSMAAGCREAARAFTTERVMRSYYELYTGRAAEDPDERRATSRERTAGQ